MHKKPVPMGSRRVVQDIWAHVAEDSGTERDKRKNSEAIGSGSVLDNSMVIPKVICWARDSGNVAKSIHALDVDGHMDQEVSTMGMNPLSVRRWMIHYWSLLCSLGRAR